MNEVRRNDVCGKEVCRNDVWDPEGEMSPIGKAIERLDVAISRMDDETQALNQRIASVLRTGVIAQTNQAQVTAVPIPQQSMLANHINDLTDRLEEIIAYLKETRAQVEL